MFRSLLFFQTKQSIEFIFKITLKVKKKFKVKRTKNKKTETHKEMIGFFFCLGPDYEY